MTYDSFIGKEINNIKILKIIKKSMQKRYRTYFECICFCETLFCVRADHFINEKIKSCGCKSIELAAAGHTLPNNQAAYNIIFKGYRTGAKIRGLSFSLSNDEMKLFFSQNCFYCNAFPRNAVIKKDKFKSYKLTYNGIDRINSNLGYSIDNCVPCCSQCNWSKSNLSLSDFNEWIGRLITVYLNKGKL
jgi:hypothetical protein